MNNARRRVLVDDAALAARLQLKFDAELRRAQERTTNDADFAFALQSSLENDDNKSSSKRLRTQRKLDESKVILIDDSSSESSAQQSQQLIAARVPMRSAQRDEIRSLGGEIRLLTSQALAGLTPLPLYHLPGFLPLNQQEKLFNLLKCDGLLAEVSKVVPDAFAFPFSLLSWGDKKSNEISVKPSQLLAFDIGQQALAYVAECTAERSWGPSVHLDWCVTATYSDSGHLHMHTDAHAPGWVVILSLGAQADFRFGSSDMKTAQSCILSSGDVMILKGSEVLHGIHRVFGDAPSFWTLTNSQRLAIQMRDHREISPNHDTYYKMVSMIPVQPAV